MTVFTCAETFEEMMTCIYEAWNSRKGHANIRLELEPIDQQEMFCDYIHVEADGEKAAKVVQAVRKKISWQAYRHMFQAAHSDAPDRLDTIYRFLILGFHFGAKVTDMMTQTCVMRVLELSRKTGNESHYFREFARFTSLDHQVYVCHIEPKCNILMMTAEHFADRMPSENWIMIDDQRMLAAVHPKNEAFYMARLTAGEIEKMRRSEELEDEFTALWMEFFRTIGIEERKNPKCQRTMLPLWYRKHMTEFFSNSLIF